MELVGEGGESPWSFSSGGEAEGQQGRGAASRSEQQLKLARNGQKHSVQEVWLC